MTAPLFDDRLDWEIAGICGTTHVPREGPDNYDRIARYRVPLNPRDAALIRSGHCHLYMNLNGDELRVLLLVPRVRVEATDDYTVAQVPLLIPR